MGKDTKIEWCDSTVNGTSGCDGCELWNAQARTCYAGQLQTNRLSKSLPRLYSSDFSQVQMIPGRYAQAASWSDLRGTERPEKPWLNGKPRTIFVGDLGDTFSRAVTDEFLTRELLGAITSKQGKRHFWMLLTKRPKRLAELAKKWGGLPDNVMAMTTVTDQQSADKRVAELLQVPCHWRGLSCEPLLGPVELRTVNDARGNHALSLKNPSANKIHWVICGGESGKDARPMHPDWARSLRDQCKTAKVPFLFKQWGEWSEVDPEARTEDGQHVSIIADSQKGKSLFRPLTDCLVSADGRTWSRESLPSDLSGRLMRRAHKAISGRLLDGIEHNGYPLTEGRDA